jgi:hypothetical protein
MFDMNAFLLSMNATFLPRAGTPTWPVTPLRIQASGRIEVAGVEVGDRLGQISVAATQLVEQLPVRADATADDNEEHELDANEYEKLHPAPQYARRDLS